MPLPDSDDVLVSIEALIAEQNEANRRMNEKIAAFRSQRAVTPTLLQLATQRAHSAVPRGPIQSEVEQHIGLTSENTEANRNVGDSDGPASARDSDAASVAPIAEFYAPESPLDSLLGTLVISIG
ncbi:hypothetical protein DFS34DRAFT_590408 [Phlyctochytrium arcticum]|nr:hypothetical protein DFS34DRAFT_590408 [Phlyctochytrium arcticum]